MVNGKPNVFCILSQVQFELLTPKYISIVITQIHIELHIVDVRVPIRRCQPSKGIKLVQLWF